MNINVKGNICLEEFLMLLMDRNFNPFTFSNKRAHIINGIYQLRSGALSFYLTKIHKVQFSLQKN